MKTDSLFYSLFQRMPALLMEIAKLDISAEGYQFHAKELKQVAFRLDGILLPPEEDRQRPCVFVEVQFQPDDDFYPRFFSEIFLHLRQYSTLRPWCAVVIYPDRVTERAAPKAFCSLLELPEVRRIYLEDLPTRSAGALGLIALIVCPLDQTGEQARRVALQATPPLPSNEWLNFIETILVYKLPKLTREEIKQMIGIQNIDLKQTRFYQEIAEEERKEGRKEGQQEGVLIGEGKLLKKLLERRFGVLPAWVSDKLSSAGEEDLERWGEAVLSALTLDAVFNANTPQ
jgi:predicted transposase/invertase (TIGR01784 family)